MRIRLKMCHLNHIYASTRRCEYVIVAPVNMAT